MKRFLRRIMRRFLRLFKEYRELEKSGESWAAEMNDAMGTIGELTAEITRLQKKVVSDSNLIESLNRHIAALERRDAERLVRISFFEEKCREHLETIRELKGHLSGAVSPNDAPQ